MTEDNPPVRADRELIDLGSAYETHYWMMRFGCTKAQLIEAVRQVGTSSEAVRKQLGQ